MSKRNIFWIILILWGGALFGLLVMTKAVTPFRDISAEFNLIEQAFYALVLAVFPAFLVYFALKRAENLLSFLRLMGTGASLGLVVFVLQIMLFVLSERSVDMELPSESNLFDTDVAGQIATFSRMPIVSHFVAMFLFLGAYCSRTVGAGDNIYKSVAIGLVYYSVYVCLFIGINIWWHSYMYDLLLPPNEINLIMLFVHWIPTVYFLVLTYIYSIIGKNEPTIPRA